MSLANFPKTFGLNELSKGYFPHYFNTDANQNYEGPLPDVVITALMACHPVIVLNFMPGITN